MTGKVVLAIGMPRAGSGWHYNLIHDLIVASGGRDAREIRNRFHLSRILTEVNCNIGTLSLKRIIPVLVPALIGNTFAIKAHAGPKHTALRLIRKGMIRPTYIYRDPRDALLSAFEYGQRKRDAGRIGPFSDLDSIETAIDFMREYVRISEAWLACEQSLSVRYEDFLTEYDGEVARIMEFFGLYFKDSAFQSIIERYRPHKGRDEQKGTHFVKGKIGRYQEIFTPQQKQLCWMAFGEYLERMGYPID